MQDSKSDNITLGQKLFLVLFVPIVFFVLLEVVCRVFNIADRLSPLSQDMKLDMPTWMLSDKNTASRAANIVGNSKTIDWLSMFEEGPGFRVRLIPNIEKSVTNTFSQIDADKSHKYSVKANSVGFRSPEFTTKKDPATFRILVFGDSSSFGWGVNQDEYFSALLPQLLVAHDSSKFKNVEVLNFAIPGDSSEYGRLIFEHFVPPLESDLVIFGFGANDAKKVAVPHTIQVDSFRSKKTLQTLRYLASYSALYRTFDALLTKIRSKSAVSQVKQAKSSAVSGKRYIQNLQEMSARALSNGSKKVLLLNLCTPSEYAKRARLLAQSNNFIYFNGQSYLLKKLPEIRSGAIHPELVEEMRASYPAVLEQNPSFYVTSDACHPNKLGQRMVAEQLADIIAGVSLK